MGKLKHLVDKIDNAARVLNAGDVLYHGTRGKLDPSKKAPLFMTKSMPDAAAYADGRIPGTVRGSSGAANTLSFTVSDDARVFDADALINGAVMDGDDLDTAVMSAVEAARANGDDFVRFLHPSVEGGDMEAYIPVNPFGDESVLLDNAGLDVGSIDPRLLAPVAGVGAAGLIAQHYGTSPEIEQAYLGFSQRRASKRDVWAKLRELGEFGATVGSAVAGGIVGDLSRLGGYLNPAQPVEATEAGAQSIEQAMQYVPKQPNSMLEGFGRQMNQFSRDIEPLAAPFRQSIPYKTYEALPERAQGLIRIGADYAF